MIRAWARLVGIRRGRFGVAAPAGRLAGCCWLCCVAVGWRLCACRCDRLALALRVVGFRPAGCGLWWAVWLACWLEACRCPVPVLLEAVRLCPVGGAIGGVYIKLPGDYTGRVKPSRRGWPSPRRPVFAAALARRRRRSAGRRHWPPVPLSAGPPVGGLPGAFLVLASCLLARFGGQRSTASATERPTENAGENAGENAPDFPAPCRTAPAGPGSVRAPAPRLAAAPEIMPEAAENFQRFFRRGILRARSKSCFLVY